MKKQTLKWIISVFITSGIFTSVIEIVLPKVWSENKPPLAIINVNKHIGHAPLKIILDGVNSKDPEGKKLSYNWQIDNQFLSNGSVVKHTLEVPNEYHVLLTTKDHRGLQSTASTIIKVLHGFEGAIETFNIYLKASIEYDIETIKDCFTIKGQHVLVEHLNSVTPEEVKDFAKDAISTYSILEKEYVSDNELHLKLKFFDTEKEGWMIFKLEENKWKIDGER